MRGGGGGVPGSGVVSSVCVFSRICDVRGCK